MWANTEEVFVVNGFVNKADGNFEFDFRLAKCVEDKVVIGSFIGNDSDMNVVRNAGCTAVLDI